MSTAKRFRLFAAIAGIAMIVLALSRFALATLAPEVPQLSPASETLAAATLRTDPRPTPTSVRSQDRVRVRWLVDSASTFGLDSFNDPDHVPARERVVADFNASQDEIELIIEYVHADRDVLATMIAYGTLPDIIGPPTWGGWGGSNAFHGQWLDLAPYIESTGFDTSIYNPALVAQYQTGEGQIGLPFMVYPAAIYYVPAMFDEAGLAYLPRDYGEKYTLDGKAVDWNWDTLAEVAKRLTMDTNGNNATESGFDATQIVQIGFSPQWQTHVAYQASYIAGAADIVAGEEGNYRSAMPDSWKAANRWVYEGMWGKQPFIATGPLAAAPEFGNGNLFNSGKAAMALTPLWYTCCLGTFREAGFEFDAGVIPVGADGQPHGRVDGDTFRIWKGTKHPEEAFKALAYMIGPEGVQTLFLGSDDVAPGSTLDGLPAHPAYQQPYIDKLLKWYPFTTAETWDVFLAGLSYADDPSAEQWQPNWNEAWRRQQAFFDLLQNTAPGQFDFEAEWQKMVDDLNEIYNR